jgi:hypothetical protein
MKYLSKSFSTPANSRAYVENWDSVFGEEELKNTCLRCYEAGLDGAKCDGGEDVRLCVAPRPWTCFCHARMKDWCLCGAWDDV